MTDAIRALAFEYCRLETMHCACEAAGAGDACGEFRERAVVELDQRARAVEEVKAYQALRIAGFAIALALAIIGGCIAAFAQPAEPTIRVVDGDTIEIGGEMIRIVGLDAPETRHAKCAEEAARGIEAARALEAILAGQTITLERGGKDKHKRTLARVMVNGEDVAELMIEAGHARPYHCRGTSCPRREPWCDQ